MKVQPSFGRNFCGKSAFDGISSSLLSRQEIKPIAQSSPQFVMANDTFVPQKGNKSEKGVYLKSFMGATLSLMAGFGLVFCVLNRNPKNIVETVNEIVPEIETKPVNTVLKLLKEQMQQFPLDIPYREDLIKGLGKTDIAPESLRSVIGPQEYSHILTEFKDSLTSYSPGTKLMTSIKDDFDFLNKDNGLYRANMHMHTLFSDGKIDVKTLLDQASEYADYVASKFNNLSKAQNAPFTIAITDHDTVKGAQKAVEIIAENPEKYKNLRVILGCEMTVENKTISKQLNRPINNHMLLHGINPFDNDLVKFFDKKSGARVSIAQEMIGKATKMFNAAGFGFDNNLSYEDSKELYPVLKHGLTHMYLSVKDYVQFKTIFAKCVEQNQDLHKVLLSRGVDSRKLNYITPKEKYLNTIKGDFGDKYWKKYSIAVQKYLSELTGIEEGEFAQYFKIPSKMEKFFDDVQKMTYEYVPKLEVQDYYVDIEEALSMLKKQKYGYAGIAHPALTQVGSYLKNSDDSISAMKELISKFKEVGGDRAKFIEKYYHYYGNWDDVNSKNWLRIIEETAEKAGLDVTGSLDTHGVSIFKSG